MFIAVFLTENCLEVYFLTLFMNKLNISIPLKQLIDLQRKNIKFDKRLQIIIIISELLGPAKTPQS